MDLNELNAHWQQQRVPTALDQTIMKKIGNRDATLKKENLKLTYALAGTIYLTGFVVFPLLGTSITMFLLAGIWFLIGIQVMVFWLRQTHVRKAMPHDPQQFIQAKLARLRYSLLVTNVFMPIYLVLLGVLSSLYLFHVLEGIDYTIRTTAIVVNCLFYVIVFFAVWKKQRARDTSSIIPHIQELESVKAGYANG